MIPCVTGAELAALSPWGKRLLLLTSSGMWFLTFLVMSFLLVYDPTSSSILLILVHTLLAPLWMWAIHYISHFGLPITCRFDLHLSVHHRNEHRSLFLDIFTEVFAQIGFVCMMLLAVHFVNLDRVILTDILFYYILCYVVVHMWHYRPGRSYVHALHHTEHARASRICNLGFDITDHLMGTSADGAIEDNTEFAWTFLIVGILLVIVDECLKAMGI